MNALLLYPEFPDTIWSLFHHPSRVPLAVTLAIYGYHFRRTCRALG